MAFDPGAGGGPKLGGEPRSFLSAIMTDDIDSPSLADMLKGSIFNGLKNQVVIVDCRRFLDYNVSHIRSAINVCCSKLVRRRLVENKMSAVDLLKQQMELDGSGKDMEVVLYDEVEEEVKGRNEECSIISVLIEKLNLAPYFRSVKTLRGGFADFQARFPELCEGASGMAGAGGCPGIGGRLALGSLSQPCLPVSNQGPTKILPFLFLGSQQDALDEETLRRHGIEYVLNLTVCGPTPTFLPTEHQMRIPVNDSYSEKLLPYFEQAFEFLDRVHQSGACVLVHCLAGISRSPTLAIAYIMRHLQISSEEAYRYVKEKRPSISPNFNFLGQLLEFEKQLRSTKTPGTSRTEELPGEAALPVPPKRLFSCPIKIQKGPERTGLRLEFSQSPASEVNANGKRGMGAATTVAAVPGASPGVFLGPLGPPGPATVKALPRTEDLPSPSTEMSKLSFDTDERKGAVLAAAAAPLGGAKAKPRPRLSVVAEYQEGVVEELPGGGAADVRVQTGEGAWATNPLFPSGSSDPPAKPVIFAAQKLGSEASTSRRRRATEPGWTVENPLFRLALRSSLRRKKQAAAAAAAAAAVATEGSPPSPSSPMTGLEVSSRPTLVVQTVQTVQAAPAPAQPPRPSFTARISQLFKRASWPHGVPYMGTLEAGLRTRSSTTCFEPAKARKPPKSRSASLLCPPGPEVDSPESGFAEEVPMEAPMAADPERDSISSGSSLEIAAIS